MLRLSFNHVFFFLMTMSFIGSFVLPPRFADLGRVQLEVLFIPISRPTYHLANYFRGRVVTPPVTDNRDAEDVKDENFELRKKVNLLNVQIEQLQAQLGERQSLGDLQSLCDRFVIAGADSGTREGLFLGGTLNNIALDQPVLSNGCLIGKIDRLNIGSAHVRLVTDPGSAVTAYFIRFVKTPTGIESQRVSQLLPIVQGAGSGKLTIINLPFKDVTDANLQPEDWLILADETFPAAVQHIPIGKIATITQWSRAPLFAEIRLEAQPGYMHLRDVWVMTRGK
jgi:cell shape-determining protein MreC